MGAHDDEVGAFVIGTGQDLFSGVADEHLALGFHAGEVFGHESVHGLFSAGDDLAHEVFDGVGRHMEAHILAQRGSRVDDDDAGPQALGQHGGVLCHGRAVFGKVNRAKNLLDFLHGTLHYRPNGQK